jgi:hypothetical protein
VTTFTPAPDRIQRGRLPFLVTVPIAYAALLLFHPIPERGPVLDGLESALDRWNVVHVVQLAFIGAMAAAVVWLLQGTPGRAATVGRASALVFAVVYGAYESWTGIGTGALVSTSAQLPRDDLGAASVLVQGHWESTLLGNGSVGAILGSTAWLVATVAAALALRRAGAPTRAVACLVGSGVLFAPTHVPPFGPAGMILFALAVVLLAEHARLDADSGMAPATSTDRKSG